MLALFDQSSDRFLTACGLHPRCALNSNALEIGYWKRTSETGKGLATLATQILTIYCFEGLGCDRVQISHNINNDASRRVIEKCGFVPEGKIRNAIVNLPSEWIAAGLDSCRDLLGYSLLPDDAKALYWYQRIKGELQVFDQLKNCLGHIWS